MELHFFTYKIPFKRTFSTAQENFKFREGVIIVLKKNGITAMGEAAPLPGFSKEALPALIIQIRQNKPSLKQFFNSDFTLDEVENLLNDSDLLPSICFGLFTLTAAYLAQEKHVSLQQLLFDDSSEKVGMNAIIDLQTQNIHASVQEYVEAGFSTIKIKTANNWPRSLSSIKKIRSDYTKLKMRVDANRSWNFQEAKRRLQQMELLNIEYCEEPLVAPSKKLLKTLSNSTSTPIALDETMAQWPEIQEKTAYAQVFILKPMVLGSDRKISPIVNFANKNGKKIIFTTALGTGIERLMTATLAAKFGSPDSEHGLNTGYLLQTDVWTDQHFIKNGVFHLPDAEALLKIMQSDLQQIPFEII